MALAKRKRLPTPAATPLDDGAVTPKDVDLASLGSSERDYSKTVCYKIVEIFAPICQRKLWLKNADDGVPKTNGNLIEVPFKSPEHLTDLEHELAHILFRSDFLAKKNFINIYSDQIEKIASQHGVTISATELRGMLDAFINILEDRRVNSLWGLLYPGTGQRLKEESWEKTAPYVEENSRDALATFFVCLLGGHRFDASHPFARFQASMVEALEQVEKRGFASTLAVTKRLVSRLVDEIIAQTQSPPPPSDPQAGGSYDTQAPGDSAHNTPSSDGTSDADDEGEDQQNSSPTPGAESTQSGDGDTSNQQPGSQGSDRPQASAKDRTQALVDLIKLKGNLPQQVKNALADYQEPKYTSHQDRSQANKTTQQALHATLNDDGAFDDLLAQDRADMYSVLADARKAIAAPKDHDDFLVQGAMAKVELVNVPPAPAPKPLSEEDQVTVRRLRALFQRVLGKRRALLEETGTEVDVEAFIERRLTGLDVPCFRHDVAGHGFRCLMLIDQSGSMNGEKYEQANRACRVIRKALDFPFVDTTVWGFSQCPSGDDFYGKPRAPDAIVLERFHTKTQDYGKAKNSMTPLHTALRVGRKEIEGTRDAKHLIVLTDGAPTAASRSSRRGYYSGPMLRQFVQEDVIRARKKGVQVTAVVIGNDVTSKHLDEMFGRRYWRRVEEETFGNDLIALVAGTFLKYLKNL